MFCTQNSLDFVAKVPIFQTIPLASKYVKKYASQAFVTDYTPYFLRFELE